MISYIFNIAGKAIRECVDLTEEVIEDIGNIPSALLEGYNEGLFSTGEKEEKEEKEVKKEVKKEEQKEPVFP